MSKTIHIAYDHADPKLGSFFSACANCVIKKASACDLNIVELDSDKLDSTIINQCTSQAKEYIFVAFSHGSSSALWGREVPYIQAGYNLSNFYNSILYTFACSAGISFYPELIKNNIPAYYGYKSKAWASTNKLLIDVFVRCAVKGIISFLSGRTLKEAADDLLTEYTNSIQETRKMFGLNNPVSAALLKNKQALAIIIRESDMIINHFPTPSRDE